MTSMPEHSFIQKAKDSGCDSFWYKEKGNISLLEICDRTMNGEFIWPDNSPTIIIGLAKSDEFTDRELDVIRALATGYRYEEMAAVLYMSPNTVKYHVKNILQKTERNWRFYVGDQWHGLESGGEELPKMNLE